MRYTAILRYFGILIVGYILLLSLAEGEIGIQPIFTIVFGLCIWIIGKNVHIGYEKYGGLKIFLGLLIIGAVIRFLWAIFIPTLPVSDFQYYHESALALSQGTPTLTKNMGFTLLLSLGYRIWPSVLTGKIINAIAGTLSILFLYLLGAKLINPQVGLISALVFVFFPSEVIMVSVLGTEVVATMIGLIIAFFLFSFNEGNFRLRILSLFLTGLFYGLALTIRSSFLFYFPAILLYIFLLTSLSIKQKAGIFGIFLVGAVAGLSVIILSYSSIEGHLSIEPIRKEDSFPFLSGTNVPEMGQWNQSDADLYFSWPSSERDKLARQEAFRRITSNPRGLLEIIPVKIAVLMGDNSYGSLWSLKSIDWGEGNSFGIRASGSEVWNKLSAYRSMILRITGLLTQSTYIIIWFFALLAFKDQEISLVPVIVLTVIIFTLLPHTVLEVQSRYHHYIMPFIILLAAYRIGNYPQNLPKNRLELEQEDTLS